MAINTTFTNAKEDALILLAVAVYKEVIDLNRA